MIPEQKAILERAKQPETSTVRELMDENARLKAERDEYRAKLAHLADKTEVSGLSWGGFNILGDSKSIKAVHSAIHYGGQIDEYRKEFAYRSTALTAAKAENERFRRGLETLATTFYKEDQHQDYAKHVLGPARNALGGDNG